MNDENKNLDEGEDEVIHPEEEPEVISSDEIPDDIEFDEDEELPVDLEDDEEYALTMGEEMDSTRQVTNVQAVLKSLTPTFSNKRVNALLQPAMVSRIFPDNFMDKHFLLSAALIEEYDPFDDPPVIDIISWVQDGLSIGFEGRGIGDRLEVAGAASDEEMEKLSKQLGLSS